MPRMDGDAEVVAQELVDAEQVGIMLLVCKRTVFRMVKDGRLPPPCLRRGKKFVRWRKSDIQRIYEETKK